MTWRMGGNAPEKMAREAVDGNIAYFRAGGSKVYSYQNILGKEQWSQLPDNHNENCCLAVVNGFLTSVGGTNNGPTNTPLSLTGEGRRKQWSEIFPPMHTPRSAVACTTTEQALVVAGGYGYGDYLNTVEMMNINTKQWTTVSPLPQKQSAFSATVCGDTLYLAGGTSNSYKLSTSVFTCSLPDLLISSNSLGSKIRRSLSQSQNVWKEISSLPVAQSTLASFNDQSQNVWKVISSLPVARSTLASFNGQVLAIGGKDDSENRTTNVYRYYPKTNSWRVINQMKNKRSSCLAVTLPEGHIIVVGGHSLGINRTDSVEILE